SEKMCTFAHGYVCFLVNCKDNQKRADTNTSASPNLLMGLQCLADSNSVKYIKYMRDWVFSLKNLCGIVFFS
ncbi:MAG: hypothetical protein II844_01945, partial [Prevotella sp.]|nr:hypothetical protein [Prevotella sp.]